MKTIGVLGGGISGLSFGKLANTVFKVEILEKSNDWGGIAKTLQINDSTYHPIGGHCFNSKYPEVLDFVFNKVLDKDKWHIIQRNAVIKLLGNEIDYPIEYSIKQINKLNHDLALNITKDFLSANDDGNYKNLEDWFRKKFGDTLSELYFIPYNNKIWNKHPSEMSPAWVEGKLPLPNKNSFFQSLLSDVKDQMPHASFFYPNSNNQKTFIDALAEGLNIECNYEVKDIFFDKKISKWVVNGEKLYDILINTLPLNHVCKLIKDAPIEIINYSNNLKYNQVTTMFWETETTDKTWTYIPEGDNFFHRYIHIGNFFSPKKNYTITEVIGRKTYEEMVENGEKDPFLIKPLAYNVSEHAYVVFDQNYDISVNGIKNYLDSISIKTLGRFGEWEYYNMDICIKKSMDLFNEISSIN
ncbi:NAD(P)-binding protein [Pedobacter sp. SD-b]|uniref:NAD(P)-binding protein n=1 Tax=Pedobacter segetis TaxID=2793069 RepID=A0ABS1BMG5_9SPHI|nr:NAD(P)-binding protein [Pedobacter segetis]MBK0384092.1 NAD(P)-binding protein [Pedobacter segetis]